METSHRKVRPADLIAWLSLATVVVVCLLATFLSSSLPEDAPRTGLQRLIQHRLVAWTLLAVTLPCIAISLVPRLQTPPRVLFVSGVFAAIAITLAIFFNQGLAIGYSLISATLYRQASAGLHINKGG